jgi:mitogen-activated protein kinase 1/3
MQSETKNIWADIEESYKVLQTIGSGSFGQVIKAQHKETKKVVAIKLIEDLYSSPYTFKKVVREI